MQHIRDAIRQNHLLPPTSTQPNASVPAIASVNASAGFGDPNCPTCHGIGYLRQDRPLNDPKFGKIDPCVCVLARRGQELKQKTSLTRRDHQVRLADLDVEGRSGSARVLEACRAFIQEPKRFLVIDGGPGTGKTMALQATVNAVNADGSELAAYASAPDLIRLHRLALSSTHDARSDEAAETLRRLEDIRVLALDEWDAAEGTPWERQQLTGLLKRRYALAEAGLAATLIAMNGDPSQQPEAIASRLMDGRNVRVHNDDPDIRPALKS